MVRHHKPHMPGTQPGYYPPMPEHVAGTGADQPIPAPKRWTPPVRWPLYLISVGAVGLVGARMAWPWLPFDNNSLILLGVAALALVVAYLPLKSIKWGELEAEFNSDVAALAQKVVASEQAPPPKTPRTERLHGAARASYDKYAELLSSRGSNVEKILGAGVMLEQVVDAAAKEFEFKDLRPGAGTMSVLSRFAREGLVGQAEMEAFRDFWAIRNKVVHQGYIPTDDQTARLLDLAWRLIRVFGL